MHYFSTAFLADMASRMRLEARYHLARKAIPSVAGPVQARAHLGLIRDRLVPSDSCWRVMSANTVDNLLSNRACTMWTAVPPMYNHNGTQTALQTAPAGSCVHQQGVKLELFIFDSFPLAERCALLEVRRGDEFAPVKNAPGAAADSPDTARAATLALHTRCARGRGLWSGWLGCRSCHSRLETP